MFAHLYLVRARLDPIATLDSRPDNVEVHSLRPFLVTLALFLFAETTLFAQVRATQEKPANLGFESGAAGEVPVNWFSPAPGFEAKTVQGDAKEGTKAALLRAIPGGTDSPNPFGNLMQVVDAAPYRGHWIRFRGAVKVKAGDDNSRAQLWLRVDRPEKQTAFFDNMAQRPILSPDWAYYEITGDVASDAATLNFGLILLGGGEASLDDVSITDLGKVELTIEPARAATGRGLDNLAAFAKLLGYVRHFHPSDQAAATDWNRFAVAGVRAVEGATSAADLAKKLDELTRPIAPTVQVYVTGQAAKKNDRLPPVADRADVQVVSWRHTGFGQGKDSFPYKSERLRADAPHGKVSGDGPDPRKPLEVDLGGGVSARIPLAVFADKTHTLPEADIPSEKLAKYSGDDRATRLADVMLLWNVMQHFYPYFDVVKTDWNAQLRPALNSAATDADQLAFLVTLRRIVAQLHDGHGGVSLPAEGRNFALPLLLQWVEGKLVVLQVADESAGIKAGDVIEGIDGRPSLDWLREREMLISSATPQWLRVRSISDLRNGTKDSAVSLDVRSGAEEKRTIQLRRTTPAQELRESRPPKLHELETGIWYVDLARISDADFDGAMPQLEKAKGVIFDLRGYPAPSIGFLQHLIDKPVQSAQWMVPIVTRPDHAFTEWDRSGRWTLQPKAPRLPGTIVFLTDGRAISYAESVMGVIEAYHLAEIVGEPTAGTNGNVNPITLPGGYNFSWTGMRVLKNDGSTHHGVGIQPTVPTSRTIRGIAEKRDEQLERAVAIVKEKSK
jgi:C-terminal processing protease CtpA/Prc